MKPVDFIFSFGIGAMAGGNRMKALLLTLILTGCVTIQQPSACNTAHARYIIVAKSLAGCVSQPGCKISAEDWKMYYLAEATMLTACQEE